jgi:hypothetical protein
MLLLKHFEKADLFLTGVEEGGNFRSTGRDLR